MILAGSGAAIISTPKLIMPINPRLIEPKRQYIRTGLPVHTWVKLYQGVSFPNVIIREIPWKILNHN